MTLEGSHWIRGYFYDGNGDPISGASVIASNITGTETGTKTTHTTGSGYYQINVQDICDEDDLMQVEFRDGADVHKIADEFIRVDLDNLTQEVNATFESQFEINTDTYKIYLPMPKWDGVNNKLDNNIRLFNFKSGEVSTIYVDISNEAVKLSGYFSVDTYTRDTISGKVEAMIDIQNNGEEITIYDVNTNINYVYVVRKFSFKSVRESPNLFEYSCDLEYVESYAPI